MSKQVKAWTQEGFLRDDADIPRLRSEFEKIIIEEMRESGYLPVQEIPTVWQTAFMGKQYSFRLVMYGAFAGKKKALEYDFYENWQLRKYK